MMGLCTLSVRLLVKGLYLLTFSPKNLRICSFNMALT
jgi:hypothetical protein